jgi:hypothetical protein
MASNGIALKPFLNPIFEELVICAQDEDSLGAILGLNRVANIN